MALPPDPKVIFESTPNPGDWMRRLFVTDRMDFFPQLRREPGERAIWGPDETKAVFLFPPEPYDDGGGAALAEYRYGMCSTAGKA